MLNWVGRVGSRRRLKVRIVALFAVLGLVGSTLIANPLGAVTITAANDVDITEVVLNDNGTTVTQMSSGGTPQQSGSTPVDLVSISLDDDGTAVVLDNFHDAIDATNFGFPSGLTGVRTYENGIVTELADPGFEASLEAVVPSSDLRDYLAYDGLSTPGSTFNPDFDVLFGAPLTNDDYVVVIERNGNTFFDLIPLDVNGNVIPSSDIIGFDAPYGWNTNYAPSEFATQESWITVADVENFQVDTTATPIWGFRVNNDGQADVKFFGASSTPLELSSLAGTVEVDDGTPIEGVTITLTGTDENGDPVSETTTTDEFGNYLFEDLLPGTYTVTESQPAGYGDTTDVVGSEGGTLADDEISAITLGAGVDAVDYDFVETLSSIAGTVFHDVNDNGVPDSGEDAIPGTIITLSGTDVNGDAVSDTRVTNDTGDYVFDGLLAGTYTVTETQPDGFEDGQDTAGSTGGDTSTNDVIADIALPAGEDSVDNDFGELLPPELSSIAGTVEVDDGTPIEGVTIELFDENGDFVTSTTTDEFGNYVFADLPTGEYDVVQLQPDGYGNVTPNVILDIAVDGDDISDVDFVETTASLAGSVLTDEGDAIEGVTITLTGTDINGDPVSETTTTDDFGNYVFEDLLAGEYTVTETQPDGFDDETDVVGSEGGVLANDEISAIPLGAGVDATDYDFVEIEPADPTEPPLPPDPASLAGSVLTDDGTPIAGVTITLTGIDVDGNLVLLTTMTNALGEYVFEDLVPGTYAVTESQPDGFDDGTDVVGSAGGTLANDEISVITLDPGVVAVGYDFIETVPPAVPEELGAVQGVVFRDGDTDGQRAGADVLVAGVTVNLLAPDGTVIASTVTDVDGVYNFTDLTPGDYVVEIVPPSGDELTSANVGDDSLDSDFAFSTNRVEVSVFAGQVTSEVDAGLVESQPQSEAPPILALTGSSPWMLVIAAFVLMIIGATQLGICRTLLAGARRE